MDDELTKEQRLARHIWVTTVDRWSGEKQETTLGEVYFPWPVPKEVAEDFIHRMTPEELHSLELDEIEKSLFNFKE